MALVHGQAITSSEIESICGQFSAVQFAALCNSLSFSISKPAVSSLPSYTERVNVGDGGIDAEWTVVQDASWAATSPLIGLGWNVFQYKQRNVTAQGRDKTFTSLKNDVKGAVKDAQNRTGRLPDRYVLFTPIDLGHVTANRKRGRRKKNELPTENTDTTGEGQKQELRTAICHGLSSTTHVDVRIVGAAELASLLNQVPHIRSAFFATSSFTTWSMANEREATRSKHLYGTRAEMVARHTELDELTRALRDPGLRAVVLVGPPGIGKTRLTLEATVGHSYSTVFALEPALSVPDLLALNSPGEEIVVVVEDPDPDVVKRLIDTAVSRTDIKILITLPTPENAPPIGFGEEQAVCVVKLKSLDTSEAAQLLRAVGANFSWSTESWVINQAAGNPGVLLAAAYAGDALTHEASSFSERVSEVFERRVRRIATYGEEMYRVLRLLSVLAQIGVEGILAEEIQAVHGLFGDGISREHVYEMLPRLVRAGFIRERGRFVEVVPPIFANALARSLFRRHFEELRALFEILSPSGRRRFLTRLQYMGIGSEEVTRFWKEIMGPQGLVHDLSSALANSALLEALARAVPARVSYLLTEELHNLTAEERRAVRDADVRKLVSVLNELLFRSQTSAAALECLALLAEIEPGKSDNPALGLFSEALHPLHAQVPLPLEQRLELVREMADSESSWGRKEVAVRALIAVLSRHAPMILRPSEGAEPLDSQPEMTWGEVWDYLAALLDLLFRFTESENDSLVALACSELPAAIAECSVPARPEATVARYTVAVEAVIMSNLPIPVSTLAICLNRTQRQFSVETEDISEDLQIRLLAARTNLQTLIDRLDSANFRIRIRKWAGEYNFEHDLIMDEEEVGYERTIGKALQDIADEAVLRPELLDEDTTEWLLLGYSGEAQQAQVFWRALGRADTTLRLLPIIQRIGRDPRGIDAFGWYFGGLAEEHFQIANHSLETLLASPDIRGEALALAISLMPRDDAAIVRLETLLIQGRVHASFVERILHWGQWLEGLRSAEFVRLCRAMAGQHLENAAIVIESISWWLHLEQPFDAELSELAWRCLESAPAGSEHGAYACDKVATNLCRQDPNRAFRLVPLLLEQPFERRCWNPLDLTSSRGFIALLAELDRERLIRILISSVQQADWPMRSDLSEDLRKHLDQEANASILQMLIDEGEETAVSICSCITPDKPGFWPLAFRILERYRNSDEVARALIQATWERRVLIGGFAARFEKAHEEVDRVLHDPSTPAFARPWLHITESTLREWALRERRQDEEQLLDYDAL
jgi:hypothetical protein